MEEWRSKAVENFPELRGELVDTDEIFSPYALWSNWLPGAQRHRSFAELMQAEHQSFLEPN